MSENDENKSARATQEEEMKKLGITPHSERVKGKDSELDSEEEDIDEEEVDEEPDEEEDEDSEDEEEDEEKDEDEDEEEEEDEEEGQSHKKKGISFKQFNQLRSDLREANRKLEEITKSGGKKADEIPDDFAKRTEALAKEIGVENPEGLKKIMALMKEVSDGKTKGLEEKLAKLEEKLSEKEENAPIKDDFQTEWKPVDKSLRKEFPDASDEEITEARKLMYRLSHTPNIGGKVMTDKTTGKEILDPYPLDFILYKNRSRFENIFGGEKTKGMETSRTQGRGNKKEEENENKPLKKNASVKDIREYEKRAARAMEGMDNLSEPVDDRI